MDEELPLDAGNTNIYAGDDAVLLEAEFYDASDNPDLMTGITWRAMWRLTPENEDFLLLSTAMAGHVLTVSLSAAQTNQMDCMGGVWDVEATDSVTGEVLTWFKGTTTWEGDVTR